MVNTRFSTGAMRWDAICILLRLIVVNYLNRQATERSYVRIQTEGPVT